MSLTRSGIANWLVASANAAARSASSGSMSSWTGLSPRIAIAGSIKVATVYSIGLHELPPYVKRFIKAHPQVKVNIEYSRTDKV